MVETRRSTAPATRTSQPTKASNPGIAKPAKPAPRPAPRRVTKPVTKPARKPVPKPVSKPVAKPAPIIQRVQFEQLDEEEEEHS